MIDVDASRRAQVRPYFDDLLAPYRTYCRFVSKRSMAISIETAAFVAWLCATTQPAKAADLGSGFTSFVLRHCGVRTVASVDDSATWLGRTRAFCDSQHVDATTGFHGPEWQRSDERYNLIVHDYSGGATREAWMTTAIEHLTDDGVIVFDDAQNVSHRNEMVRVCEEHGLILYDIRDITLDEVGRYAAMGVRP
jgi:predicted O-methyltransferase YrrM